MNNIIGGEFSISLKEINNSSKELFIPFSSGRGALAAILKKLIYTNKDTKIVEQLLLPDYLCSSITQVCIDEKLSYQFFHIKEDLLPDEEDLFSKLEKKSVVFLISYFGVVNIEVIAKKIKKQNSNVIIILDDVQNFYSNYTNSTFWDYRFNSYRKWFPVPDGAEVFCKSGRLDSPKTENSFAQYNFSGNVLKNFSDWVDDKLCLDLLEKGEQILNKDYNCECSKISRQLIPDIFFEEIKTKRKENASFLHSELEKLGIKHIYDTECVPLFIPIFLKNRTEVRKKMFTNNIFTPVHWPYESDKLNGTIKNQLYETEISLICDQRYSLEDMKRQIEVLEKCI